MSAYLASVGAIVMKFTDRFIRTLYNAFSSPLANFNRIPKFYVVWTSEGREKQSISVAETKWIVDSACTYHSCSERDKFANFIPINMQMEVANGSRVTAKGKGNVGIFTNVYYVPCFTANRLLQPAHLGSLSSPLPERQDSTS